MNNFAFVAAWSLANLQFGLTVAQTQIHYVSAISVLPLELAAFWLRTPAERAIQRIELSHFGEHAVVHGAGRR